MQSFLLPIFVALAACMSASQEAAAQGADTVQRVVQTINQGSAFAPVQDKISKPVLAIGPHQVSPSTPDIDAAMQGRRTLSTHFVRLEPGGYLLVMLRGGEALALRDVTMEKVRFCGALVTVGVRGKRLCYSYAQVATARTVNDPNEMEPAPVAPNVIATQHTPGR